MNTPTTGNENPTTRLLTAGRSACAVPRLDNGFPSNANFKEVDSFEISPLGCGPMERRTYLN